ncbi:MAG: DNA mismatch repair endonuclease MutL [candidate division WOR-3 bacterium]
MGMVKLLPEEVVRRIAAGEVILRPASVVKELIENSLDAGAKRIKVEVKSGGKNLIRVTDDGCGMDRDDVLLAVSRYATSKLTSVEDLSKIQTYGFRGEALAAIAAVSRMSIETNTDEGLPGIRLEVEGGEIKEIAETARAKGTTVTVRMLFFNLPVRRGFLKSEGYELRLALEVFRNYCIAFPGVGFEFISNERSLVKLYPVEKVRDRLYALFEKKMVEGMVEVKIDNPLIGLYGFFTAPSQVKGVAEVQAIFFNQRPVRSQVVNRAVYDGYGPMPTGSQPNFILFLQTDPSRLDVNVHPTKQEVRFADERFLFDFVAEAVRKGLGIEKRSEWSETGLLQSGMIIEEESGPSDFWQLHNSYIFAEVASGYVIVDQHAAHERILFEELLSSEKIKPQGLLFPFTLELKADEFEAYERISEKLQRMGLETKLFSGNTVVVETIPSGAFLGKDELREFFAELPKISSAQVQLFEELAKLIACKGAVKAGQRLSREEMASLINRLFACREPYFCPHGRPVIIKITFEDLARRFGRI